MPAIETRIEGVWWAKQTAKGSPAATPAKQGRKVGGDITVNRDDANENFSDGTRFPSAADFANTLVGNGNPIVQGQPGVLGHLAWLFSGQETVTGTGPYVHVATPNNVGGFWSTWWKKLGAAVGPQRQKFNDCRLSSLRIEGSSAAKVVRITPTFVSLDPGEVFTADPSVVLDVGEPMLFTDGEATFTIDSEVIRAHSSFAIVLGDNVTPWYGDSVLAHDVTFGAGQVTIENITILVDANGYAMYNKLIYGTAAPAAGAKPLKSVPALGNYQFNLWRGGTEPSPTEQFKFEMAGARWSPDVAIPGNPDGGAVELTLGAEARSVGSNPMYKITTKSADAAYTA